MANPEKNFAERAGETVRNVGIVIALLGTIAWLARFPFGSDRIIFAGAGLGLLGEGARRLAKSK